MRRMRSSAVWSSPVHSAAPYGSLTRMPMWGSAIVFPSHATSYVFPSSFMSACAKGVTPRPTRLRSRRTLSIACFSRARMASMLSGGSASTRPGAASTTSTLSTALPLTMRTFRFSVVNSSSSLKTTMPAASSIAKTLPVNSSPYVVLTRTTVPKARHAASASPAARPPPSPTAAAAISLLRAAAAPCSFAAKRPTRSCRSN
mmetsp:Transcript_25290/g.88242  ORF Transcript_25290/g.88242 Transcript_25290/m.88242 type:complete len:202 (+) Transcript_25290:165-770(+)